MAGWLAGSRIPRPAYLTSLLAQPLAHTNDTATDPSWSIGLEPAGCCAFDSSSASSLSLTIGSKGAAGGQSGQSGQSGQGTVAAPGLGSNSSALFWLGLGSDCMLPCFDTLGCRMLFGSSYSALMAPCALRQACSFAPFAGRHRPNQESDPECIMS